MRILWTFMLVTWVTLAQAAEFPTFTADCSSDGNGKVAALHHGATVVLRWRAVGSDDPLPKVQNVASRLNRLAYEGVAPADIVTQTVPPPKPARNGKTPSSASILIKGTAVLTVDASQAALSHSTPVALADLWARRLKTSFADPYIVAPTLTTEIPAGDTRPLKYGGRLAGGVTVNSYDQSVALASVDGDGRTVLVRGVAPGTTLVGLRSGAIEALATVVVRKWAARMQDPVVVRVSGGLGRNSWYEQAARVAVTNSLVLEPGAQGGVLGLRASGENPAATVEASGPDYFRLKKTVPIRYTAYPRAVTSPVRAILSNDPERVVTSQLLARYPLSPREPINFLWHHMNDAQERLGLVVRLCNAGDGPAAVHVLGGEGGPSGDEVFVGHSAMQRYMAAWQAASGSLFELPARSQCEITRLPMPPGLVISGLAQFLLEQGSGVFVEVASVPQSSVPGAVEPVPATLRPNSQSRFLELPGTKQLEVKQQVGRAWNFVRIGRTAEDTGLHPRLRGEYAVLHDIRVIFENPEGHDARLEVAVRSGGGPARAVVDVDGTIVETGLLGEGDEALLYKRNITGLHQQVAHLRLIPQGGSNYPMTLIVRSFAR